MLKSSVGQSIAALFVGSFFGASEHFAGALAIVASALLLLLSGMLFARSAKELAADSLRELQRTHR